MTTDRASVTATTPVAGFVLAAGLIALLLLLRPGGGPVPAPFGDREPAEIEAAIAARLDDVPARRYQSIRVTGRRVEWRDESDRAFLEAPSVTAWVLLEPGGGVLITDGTIQSPSLRLVQETDDLWNYEAPLAPFLADGEGGGGDEPSRSVRLRDISVQDADVVVEMLEETYAARSLDVRLSEGQLAGVGLAGPTFRVAEAEGELVLPDTVQDGEVVRAVRLEDARFQLVDGALSFEVPRARFGSSRLANVEGVWDPALGGYGLDMRLTAVDARVADLPWLPGEVPEGATGRFDLRIEARPGDRTLIGLSSLELSAPGSSASGSVRAVIGGDRPSLEAIDVRVDPLSLDLVEAFTGPLPYGGTVRGTIRGSGDDIRLDLAGRLTAPGMADPFSTRLTGGVAITDAGFGLRDAEVALDQVPLAALDALVPGLPLKGPVTGTIQLDGAPDAGPVRLDLRLEAGGGIITVAGTADLSGSEPTYDVEGEIVGVSLRALLRPAAPSVQVHARFAAEGRGTDPRTADASLSVRGGFTGWRSEPGDTLIATLSIAGGELDADTLRVELGPVRAGAEGRWNVVDSAGAVEYVMTIDDLEPLAPFLPADDQGLLRFAQGALEATGTASGTLDAPRIAGTATATSFRWGEWAAESLSGEYTLVFGDGLPTIDAEVDAEELRTPLADFDDLELAVDFGRPTFDLVLRADQEGGRGVVEIDAGGRLDEDGRRDVQIRRLEVDLRRQRWRLANPAAIAWTAGEAIRVDGLALGQSEGRGRLSVQGTVAPADSIDVTVFAERVPVQDVARLAGLDYDLSGLLTVDAAVAGPAATPDLDIRLELAEGSFREVEIRSLRGTVRYDSAALALQGEALMGDSARLEVEGTVPARLRLAGSPLFSLVDEAPIDVRLTTRTFPLSTLDPGLAMAADLAGRLQANFRVGGTPAEPRLSGSAEVVDAAVTIPLLGRRFQGIRGAVVLSGREARIRRLEVQSDGRAILRGTLDFQELTNPALDLRAELQEFRVQGIEDEQEAGLWGTLQLVGTMDRPVLTGSIRADDGTISMLPFQQPDLSTRLTGAGRDLLEPGSFEIGDETGGGLEVRNLTFTAGSDLWFMTEEARARLAGTLAVNRGSSGATTIQGILNGEGGTFELSAGVLTRRFQIKSAEIRFFGSPEPNPRLDVVASRLVRTPNGGDVEVEIRVTGTLESPTLSLASAAGPEIPESELLSFLLFGRPTSDLGQVAGGGADAGLLGQGVAYTGALEALASQFADEVGLFDYFQLDYLPGTGALYATGGIELQDDWLVTANFPVNAETESNYWGLGVEYRPWQVRVGNEPVDRLDRLVGARSLSFIEEEVRRQWILSWRRRWTY